MDGFIDESQQLFCDKLGYGRGLTGELFNFQNGKKNLDLRCLGPLSEMRFFLYNQINQNRWQTKLSVLKER